MFLKLLFWSCLLHFGVAAYRVSYSTGSIYHYHFDSQLSHGLVGKEEAALSRMQAVVKLQFMSSDEAQVELDFVKFGAAHVDRRQFVDELLAFRRSEEFVVSPRRMTEIKRPFLITLTKKGVENLQFATQESIWSKNIKKAVVNLLQVQIHEQVENLYWLTEISNSETVEGECEVAYLLTADRSKLLTNITKTINFEKCATRPVVRYDAQTPAAVAPCRKSHRSLIPFTSTTYNFVLEDLKNGADQIITFAAVRSEYVDTDAAFTEAAHRSVSLGELTFVKETPAQENRKQQLIWDQRETLVYNTTGWVMEEEMAIRGTTSISSESPYAAADRVPMFVTLFNKMHQVLQSPNPMGLYGFRILNDAVELLPYLQNDELRQIKSVILEPTTFNQDDLAMRANLFAGLLIMAGDHNSVQMYADMVTKEELPASTIQNLPQFLNARMISEVSVATVKQMCESAEIRSSKFSYNSCLLTWSALLNRLCHDKADHASIDRERIHCTAQKKMEYVEEIMRMYSGSSERYERIVYMKVLGNTGFEEIFDKVKNIVLNPSESVSMRGQTIDSLRFLSIKMSTEIRDLLVPLILNQKERSALRINALYHVMLTKPTAELINMLHSHLSRDPSHEVRAFMESILSERGESKSCCTKGRTKSPFELSTSKTVNWLDRKFIRALLFDVDGVKGALNTVTMFGKSSVFPSFVMSGLDLATRGESFMNEYAVGVEQENLDSLIRELGSYWKAHKITEMFVRGKRSSLNPLEMLKSLMKKLGIIGRTASSTAPFLGIHLRHRNFDTGYIQLTRNQAVPEVFNDLLTGNNQLNMDVVANILQSNQEMQRYQMTNLHDVVIKIPTVFGVDLKMSSKTPLVINVAGNVNNSWSGERWSLNSDVKTKIMGSRISTVETWSPIFSAGVYRAQLVSAGIPLLGSVEMFLKPTTSLKVNMQVPQQAAHLFEAIGGTVSFVRKVPQSGEKEMHETNKMIALYDRADYTETGKTVLCPFTGLKFVMDAQYMRHAVSDVNAALRGDNMLTVTVQPTPNLSRYVTFSFDLSQHAVKFPERSETHDLLTNPRSLNGTDRSVVEQLKKELAEDWARDGTGYKITAQLNNDKSQKMWIDLQKACSSQGHLCTYNVTAKHDIRHETTVFKLNVENFVSQAQNVGKGALTNIQVEGANPKDNSVAVAALTTFPLQSKRPSTNFEFKYRMQTPVKERLLGLTLYLRQLLLEEATINLPADSPLLQSNVLLGNITYYPKMQFTVKSSEDEASITVPLDAKVSNYLQGSMGQCEVRPSEIATFDGVVYGHELGSCYSVIAKDCSSSSSPQFAVLARKMSRRGPIQIRVITANSEVKMHIGSERRVIVEVNNEKVEGESLVKPMENSMYLLDLEDYGVKVHFGRNRLTVALSKQYQELQCGLCGHYGNDATEVFRTARNELTDDLEEFTDSYVVRENNCDRFDNDNSKLENKPMKAHIVIEYRHDICFSKQMWGECIKGEKPTTSVQRTVDVACIPRSKHSVVHKMIHLAKHGKPLDFTNVHFVESRHKLTVPIACA